MSDLIRDSYSGQLIRAVWNVRRLQYADEKPDFVLAEPEPETATDQQQATGGDPRNRQESPGQLEPLQQDVLDSTTESISSDLEKANTLKPTTTQASKTTTIRADGTIIVDWYDENDPDNPKNWSFSKKAFVTFLINIYTFAVYVGSSIYTSSEGGVEQRFGVGAEPAALGLALYVFAYGIGPLLFSPLAEIPAIGRNPPYVITFVIFAVLCVPTALVDNFAGLLVLRFLLGFFGSPCLATAGASFQDMWPLHKLPYAIAIWAGAATCGPAFGPVLSAFAVTAENWRWSAWELLWISGPTCLLLILFLPETYEETILLRRAQRLRMITGNAKIKSQSEIRQAKMNFRQVTYDALIKPWQINILDPAVLFSTIYTGLVYGIYYSFFESVPLVFPVYYHFTLGTSSLVFVSVFPALIVVAVTYSIWYHSYAETPLARGDDVEPESRLLPGIFASILIPAALFLYAWTARPAVHWIAPTIGIAVSTGGTYVVMQCIFFYLPFTYPKYAASLFAANDFARSSIASGAIMFARPMFKNIGIPAGVSLLAGCTVACVGGLVYLYFFGQKLRARSKFAG